MAIHNVKQRDESDKDKDKKKEGDEPVKVPVLDQPMGLEEDPLAYLGILVDILQEWDCYSVQRGSHLADKASLQSRHVKVDPTKSPLQIDLGDRNVKAEKALNGTLLNWKLAGSHRTLARRGSHPATAALDEMAAEGPTGFSQTGYNSSG